MIVLSHNECALSKTIFGVCLLWAVLSSARLDAQAERHFYLEGPLLDFTCRLFREVRNLDRGSNIALSPISAHSAFNLVLLGAKRNSSTEREMREALGFGSMSHEDINKCHSDYARIIHQFKSISGDNSMNDQHLRVSSGNKIKHQSMRRARVDINWDEEMEFENKEREDDGKNKNKDKDKSKNKSQDMKEDPRLEMFTTILAKRKKTLHLNNDYLARTKRYYESSVDVLDPEDSRQVKQVLERLNGWSNKAGFSKPLLEKGELSRADFEAILISAINIESFWLRPLSEKETQVAYYRDGRKSAPISGKVLCNANGPVNAHYVEFKPHTRHRTGRGAMNKMRKPNESLRDLNELVFHALELPLKGHLSFIMIEPRELTESGRQLDDLVARLISGKDGNNNKLAQVLHALDESILVPIESLKFPKFAFELDSDLLKVARNMGMKRMMGGESEITEIFRLKPVKVTQIKHGALINVTEKGIKAAGYTKIKIITTSNLKKVDEALRVHIRSPFLFIIRYKGLPLFIGQAVNF